MNRQVLKWAGLGIGVVSMVALLSVTSFAGGQQLNCKMRMATSTAPAMTKHHNMCEMHMKKLNQAIEAIDEAVKEVQAGNKDKALAELAEARKIMLACRNAMSKMSKMCKMCKMGKMGKGKIVNTQCPIMGSKLNPDKVPANLTRVYNGKKVGFCCKRCPIAWDKLSDQQKQEKLDKAGTVGTDGAK